VASGFIREGASVMLTLPDAFQANAPAPVATAPSLRVSASWQPLAGAQAYRLFITQQSPGVRVSQVLATAGWLDGATKLEVPDPSQVEGWSSSWGLFSDSAVDYTMSALFSSLGVRELVSVGSFSKKEQDQWESSLVGTLQP
jgi:hypothetical protein